MDVQVLDVLGWARVHSRVSQCRQSAVQFEPMGVRLVEGGSGKACRGQIVCTGQVAGDRVGMAWDWVEMGPNVVVMADPMMIFSNLALLDDDGRQVSEQDRILVLNELAFGLDWQHRVCEAVRLM